MGSVIQTDQSGLLLVFDIQFLWLCPNREGIFIYRVRFVDVLLMVALVRGKFLLEVH